MESSKPAVDKRDRNTFKLDHARLSKERELLYDPKNPWKNPCNKNDLDKA